MRQHRQPRLNLPIVLKDLPMKLCSQCSWSIVPFLMVFFVAGVSAFLTWLTLSFSQFETMELIAGSAIVFIAVSLTLLHYVFSCMKRHCRHGSQDGHRQGAAH
jgi:apolipoprotein N-acyltransferase